MVVDGFAGRGVVLALVREHDTVLGRAVQAGQAEVRSPRAAFLKLADLPE